MEVDEIINSLLNGETPPTPTTRDTTATTSMKKPSMANASFDEPLPAATMMAKPSNPKIEPQAQKVADGMLQSKRERLAALVAGGQARQYLRKEYTIEQIDSLPKDEVERLYMRYESQLGAVLTKTLGQAMIQLYTTAVSRFFPKIPPRNLSALTANLNADSFLGHAFNGACCELYHHYGMWLAPLTTVLTTAKHCR